MFDMQAAIRAFSRACAKTGKRIAARMAIIAITTRSSISVKPLLRTLSLLSSRRWPACLPGAGGTASLERVQPAAAELLPEPGGRSAAWRTSVSPVLTSGVGYLLWAGSAADKEIMSVLRAGGRTQTAWVRSGSSYCSDSEHVARFGLGPAAKADSIVLDWPSGIV